MSAQKHGIPPIAMRYVASKHKNWKFDLDSFLEKQFPPSVKPPPVSTKVMEQQKKCFNVSVVHVTNYNYNYSLPKSLTQIFVFRT